MCVRVSAYTTSIVYMCECVSGAKVNQLLGHAIWERVKREINTAGSGAHNQRDLIHDVSLRSLRD